jgi:peptide/nickel transport system substrate-binding protein
MGHDPRSLDGSVVDATGSVGQSCSVTVGASDSGAAGRVVKRRRFRRVLVASLPVALAGLLAACGSSSSSSSSSSSTATSSTSTGSTATSAAAPSQLTIAFPAKIITLDPDLAVDTTSLAAVHLINGTLYEIQAGKTVPGLASAGSPSTDGLTWTLTLRPALKFSDGSPLTAADVKATLDRAMSDKANIYPGLFVPIKSVAAPSPTQVVFNLKYPYPSLPTILGEPALMIMPATGIAKGSAFYNAPISAGPFKLTSWGGADNASFAANPYYWGPKPLVPTVNFTTVTDFNTRLAQVRSGQIDMAIDLPPSLLPQISGNGVTGTAVPIYGFISLVPNNTRPPFNNVGVRKAMSAVLDRPKINQIVWDGKNTSIAGFWPSNFPGYDPSIPVAPNVAAAKADLAGTPCQNGCSTTLAYDAAFGWTDQTALIVQNDLAQIGIKATLEKVENATFINNVFKGDFDTIITNLYDYANIPDGMLAYGATAAGGLYANYSRYSSPEMDAAATAVVRATPDQRAPLLANIEKIFAKDQPYANLSNYDLIIASRQPSSIVNLDSAGFVEVGQASQ